MESGDVRTVLYSERLRKGVASSISRMAFCASSILASYNSFDCLRPQVMSLCAFVIDFPTIAKIC
jgi:hypothetical protein